MSSEWKIERNLCRCCHSEGTFRTMGVPCYDQGHLEVFSEMIQETFDIGMTPVAGPLCMVTYTICEVCILKLRDAHSFKKQVIKCEERFRDMYRRNYIKVDIDIEVKEEHAYPEEIKVETYQEQQDQLGMDDHHNYEDDPGDCTIILEGDNSEPELSIKQELDNKKTKGKAKSAAKTKKVPKAARTKKKASVPSEEAEKTPDEGASKPKKKKGNAQVDAYVMESQDSSKKYACRACYIAYRRLSDLRNHIARTHLNLKLIKCRLCSETFLYHNHRKKHMYDSHSLQKPQHYSCDYCERTFKRKNVLAEHMVDVHIEKDCPHCELKFTRRKYLFHLNEAHGVWMPTCGICSFRALKESALVRHQRNVHLNEKKFPCKFCAKSFYTQSYLHVHMITHKQERVFSCDVCAKTFARKECYKAHYRIHTGERPFRCDVCDSCFSQRTSLHYHMKSRHPYTRFGKKK